MRNQSSKRLKARRTQQGFTLLEIMVVIVILGVLASLVAPNVLGNKAKADRQKAISDIVALENALEMYHLDNGFYPSNEQGLKALANKPSGYPEPKAWRDNGYIRRLPTDPWGNNYYMQAPGEYGPIDIFSAGSDGQPGTDQDIGNWDQ